MLLNGGVVYRNAWERIPLRHFGIHFGTLDCLFPKRGVRSNRLDGYSLKEQFCVLEKKVFFNEKIQVHKLAQI